MYLTPLPSIPNLGWKGFNHRMEMWASLLEGPEPPVVLRDVVCPGECVGDGPVILDADVPSLVTFYLQ